MTKERASRGAPAGGTINQGNSVTYIKGAGFTVPLESKGKFQYVPHPPPVTAELEARFWAKVDKRGPTECWLWTACCTGNGYGNFRLPGRRTVTSSRYAYLLATKKWPGRYLVCHSCDTPRCCNPAHLWLGLPVDNTRDMLAKGRGRNGDRRGSKNGNAKLTEEDIHEIRRLIANGLNNTVIAARFGVVHGMISLIRLGKKWKHVA